ncbi:CPBP family intramembrane glutamic endopeptidase [Promicromonospora thailandica]|uniref:CAAX protease self-immunity n=1 Tax=Promicromonospora thailandica TaxID=765201 RepID=A0A9X2FYY7_9MICO|nr:CPBP family intramembrane glutamic endopeptidase [Promicromonospora thailandica]MCP2263932.1 CAAX protease self-immunity [Promicromonospora thailandica]BFF17749.1 CPBP family intramembrane metalloprotease [Promicromonospora thailandica]
MAQHHPGSGWLLGPDEPRSSGTVPGGLEYHRVLVGDRRRIGRGVLAIALVLAGMVVFPTVIGRALAVIDQQMGQVTPIVGGTDYTPLYHAGSMLSLALLAPWSMLVQRWLYGVPGASLHSVTARFRFDLLGKALVVFGPAWLLVTILGIFAPSAEAQWSRLDLIGLFVATLLLTPLQAAGEEYGVRGLIFRVVGSWTRSSRTGLVAGVLVSSVLFTAVHGSTDVYINVWYFVLWSCLAIITWRTGGLEIAVVLHAVLNTGVLLGALVVRVDLGAQLADRSAGVGSAVQLVPTVAVVLVTAVVWWATRKAGPVLTPLVRARAH